MGVARRLNAAFPVTYQLKPLLAEEQFGHSDIARAYDAVAKGSKGKFVLEL